MSQLETAFVDAFIESLPDPFKLASNLNSTSEQFTSALDDFKKYYILHHSAPQSSEYAQLFANIKGQIQVLNSQLFTTTNEIESATTQLNQMLNGLNNDINETKTQNIALKQKLNLVETSKNGANEMNKNYNTMYHLQYFSNFTMLLGIVIAGVITHNVFKNRSTN